MARDATPNYIKIANSDFRTEAHENVAETINENWEPGITLKDIYEPLEGPNTSKSLFQKVYNEYMGFSEEQFGDGIEDPRTIEQIKRDHERVSKYVEQRENGEISPEDFRHYLDPQERKQLEQAELPEAQSEAETTTEAQSPIVEDSEDVVSMQKAMELAQESYRKGYQDGVQNSN